MPKQVYVVQQPNQNSHYCFQKCGKHLLRCQFMQVSEAQRELSHVWQPWNAARPQNAPQARSARGPQTHLLATLSWLLRRSSDSEKNTVGLTSSPSGVILLLGEDKNAVSNLKTLFSSAAMKGKDRSLIFIILNSQDFLSGLEDMSRKTIPRSADQWNTSGLQQYPRDQGL